MGERGRQGRTRPLTNASSRSDDMDPTTTTTLASLVDPGMQGVELNFWDLIQQGALSTYPLIACSIIVVAIALERAWSLRGVIAHAAALVGQVAPALARGDVQAAKAAVGKGSETPASRIYNDILAEPH